MKPDGNIDFNFSGLKLQVERIQELLYNYIKALAHLKKSQELFDKDLEDTNPETGDFSKKF